MYRTRYSTEDFIMSAKTITHREASFDTNARLLVND